jgi:hypothetical protein
LLLALRAEPSCGQRPSNPAPAGPYWLDNFTASLRADQKPHPSVVRILAPDGSAMYGGSGTLVAVTPSHGLVVTNWHVIRDATGRIWVFFPDGFRSPATVLRTDRDWDLAALAIGRPGAQPVPIATGFPQLDEPLTIAGYGGGTYRAVSGRCVGYAAPNAGFPNEFVQLSVTARSGDSGGPIFNRRGELAGVLFGADFLETTGAYGGRVREFLTPCLADLQRLPTAPAMLAQSSTPAAGQPQPASTPGNRPSPDELGPWRTPAQGWVTAVPAAPVRSQPLALAEATDISSDPLAASWPTGPDDPRISRDGRAPGDLAPIQRHPGRADAPIAAGEAPATRPASRPAMSVEATSPGPATALAALEAVPQPAGSIPVAINGGGGDPVESAPAATPWDLARNVFALIGVLAVFLQVLRTLNPASGRKSR